MSMHGSIGYTRRKKIGCGWINENLTIRQKREIEHLRVMIDRLYKQIEELIAADPDDDTFMNARRQESMRRSALFVLNSTTSVIASQASHMCKL